MERKREGRDRNFRSAERPGEPGTQEGRKLKADLRGGKVQSSEDGVLLLMSVRSEDPAFLFSPAFAVLEQSFKLLTLFVQMREVPGLDLVIERVDEALQLLVDVIVVGHVVRLPRDDVHTAIVVLRLAVTHVDRHGRALVVLLEDRGDALRLQTQVEELGSLQLRYQRYVPLRGEDRVCVRWDAHLRPFRLRIGLGARKANELEFEKNTSRGFTGFDPNLKTSRALAGAPFILNL